MVAGTAAAVGVALANTRRLTPVFVEAAPWPQAPARRRPVPPFGMPDVRELLARRLISAAGLAAAGVAIVAIIAGMISFGVQRAQSSTTAAAAASYGPPVALRSSAAVNRNFEDAYASSQVPPDAIGGTLLAAAEEQRLWQALAEIRQQQEAQAARQSQVAAASAAPNGPSSLNAASGYAAGTILRARITVYGCVGPGGGFCNNTASGVPVFEGAAACSPDLPFGTKLKIAGDPTGRTYECLDRGALASTWIDVFFYNTADGIAWQSLLGGTVTDIEIVN